VAHPATGQTGERDKAEARSFAGEILIDRPVLHRRPISDFVSLWVSVHGSGV